MQGVAGGELVCLQSCSSSVVDSNPALVKYHAEGTGGGAFAARPKGDNFGRSVRECHFCLDQCIAGCRVVSHDILRSRGLEHLVTERIRLRNCEEAGVANRNAPFERQRSGERSRIEGDRSQNRAVFPVRGVIPAIRGTIRDDDGIAVGYAIDGDFPKYGNDDDRVDSIAVEIVKSFMNKLRKQKTYRKV